MVYTFVEAVVLAVQKKVFFRFLELDIHCTYTSCEDGRRFKAFVLGLFLCFRGLPNCSFRAGLRAAVNEVSVELKKSARLHEETQRGSHSSFVLAYAHLNDCIYLF